MLTFSKTLKYTKLQLSNKNKIIKRTMFKYSVNNGTKITRNLRYNAMQCQYYPGQYRFIRWKKIPEDDKRRFNLTKHETTHDNIQDTKTGKIEGIMTSAQNKSGSNPASFDKIAPEKVNGTFIPKKDPTTGKIELDSNNRPIPDPNKGGQWMATLVTPRQLGEDTKHLYNIQKDGQAYLDAHEKAIEAIFEKNRKAALQKPSKK